MAVTIILLAGCSPSNKEKAVITHLTTKMHTTCMGRFLIDLPLGMTNGTSYVTLYYGLGKNFKTVDATIEDSDLTPQAMAAKVTAKAADIAKDDNWETKESMLLEHRVINDHLIYLRYQGDMAGVAGSKHELYVLLGKTQLVLKAISAEGVPEAGVYEPDGKSEIPAQVEARLLKVASQIHAYDDPAKAGPGFCMGQVVINSENDEEASNMDFFMPPRPDLPAHPDLLVSLYTKALSPDDDTPLFKRMNKIEEASGVHVLRKGAATFGGMDAQEWLGEAHDDQSVSLAFAIDSLRDKPSFERPSMQLTMDTGGQIADGSYVSSSLSSNEAIALWDAIVKSVRLRPDAVAPLATAKGTP